jgi:hypothetical protein
VTGRLKPLLGLAAPLALLLPFLFADEPRVVTGLVVSGKDAISAARVRFKGTAHSTLTDTSGRFRLTGRGERVTAWKPGFFIGGVPAGGGPLRVDLRPLPAEDNPDYHWIEPQPSPQRAHNCGNCHAAIHEEWAASAHGQAGRNKHFLTMYDGSDWHGVKDRGWSLLKEHPNGSAVCSACHAPTVPFDHPGFDDFRKLDGVHAQAVHCDYCHKIADASVARLGFEHGRFAHTLLRPKEGQLFFGPLDDVDRNEDTFSPLYRDSRYCASCHEGTVFGIPVYTTYSEWLQSPARKEGKHCQTCHMTPTGKMTNIAPGRGGIERDPMTLASHRMPGADAEMLRSCLRLSARIETKGPELVVTIDLTAHDVGHRVPTGFIDRHLILAVDAIDSNGGASLRDGAVLPETAGAPLAGSPGKLFAKMLQDSDGHRPSPFWRPGRVAEDTRLEPDKPVQGKWVFARAGEVRFRLLYRRTYHQVADEKRWPGNEIVIVDQRVKAPPVGQLARWVSP